MATLKFDMSDPETKAAVAGWDPNTQYTVETGEDPTSGVVTEAGLEEEEPMGETHPGGSPGRAAMKAAMMGGGRPGMMG